MVYLFLFFFQRTSGKIAINYLEVFEMKKVFALVLTLAMLLVSFCAVAEDGKLYMATEGTFPPYEYYENGELVGIDVEIAKALADKLGVELEIEVMDFGAIISAVSTGKSDFGMAGMTVTEERMQSVNFTVSYAQGIQSVIVLEDSPITSVDDLFAEGATYTVATQEATTGYIYATDDLGEDRVLSFKAATETINALLTGKVDCVIIDDQVARKFVEANEGLVILDTSYAVEDYAICIALENTELLDEMNVALQELIDDGVVEEIVNRYIVAE